MFHADLDRAEALTLSGPHDLADHVWRGLVRLVVGAAGTVVETTRAFSCVAARPFRCSFPGTVVAFRCPCDGPFVIGDQLGQA